jgi:hypothetical protein
MSPKDFRVLQLIGTAPFLLLFGIGGAWGVYSGFQQNANSAAAVGWTGGEAEILSFVIDTSGEYERPAVSYRFVAGGR